jgi:response regulator of citrate/malate metabolism
MLKNSNSKQVKHNFMESRVIKTIEEPLTIVEIKRIKEITSVLEEHKKLTSSELSQMMGLSRTRCNEYFKIMEDLKMVEPFLSRREKYYKLKK